MELCGQLFYSTPPAEIPYRDGHNDPRSHCGRPKDHKGNHKSMRKIEAEKARALSKSQEI